MPLFRADGHRRRLGGLLCGLMVICLGLGACGGDLDPDDGPRAPLPDGNPGTPQDAGGDGGPTDASLPSR